MLPQVPFTTHLPPGVSGRLSRLLYAPEHWPNGNGWAGASSRGEAGLQVGKGLQQPSFSPSSRPGPWGLVGWPWAPGTHLRWHCVGSCWGGPAGAACGTCLHLVSPAGALWVGTCPSCNGAAGRGGSRLGLQPPPRSGWGEAQAQCIYDTWYCPGPSWTGVVLFQPSSLHASRRPECPNSLESPFLPGGHGG